MDLLLVPHALPASHIHSYIRKKADLKSKIQENEVTRTQAVRVPRRSADHFLTSDRSVATLLKKEQGKLLVQLLGFFEVEDLKAIVNCSHWEGQFY